MSTEANVSDRTTISEQEIDRIVDNCLDAYRLCGKTRRTLLRGGESSTTLEHLRLLDDYAEASLVLANFLLRESDYRFSMARLCRAVADTCAEAIEQVENEDAQLRVLYATCRRTGADCDLLLGRGQGGEPAGDDLVEEASRESFPASDPLPPPSEV